MALCFLRGAMRDVRVLVREVAALVCGVVLVLLVAALYSYSHLDPAINRAVAAGEVRNVVGIFGAYLAGILVDFLGAAAWIAPFVVAVVLVRLLFPSWQLALPRWLGWGLGCLWLLVALEWPWVKELMVGLPMQGGGLLGRMFAGWIRQYLGELGLASVLVATGLLVTRLVLAAPFAVLGRMVMEWLSPVGKQASEVAVVRPSQVAQPPLPEAQLVEEDTAQTIFPKPRPSRPKSGGRGEAALAARKPPSSAESASEPMLPPLDLLATAPAISSAVSQGILERQAQQLAGCFADFGIQGEVQAIQPGPVITLFEFKPAPGIKVSRIANLGDDLSLALKARSVRIVAPLPGKDTVGIEIPNEKRQSVVLREILESPAFAQGGGLPLALGKDAQGAPKVVDLAKMPHLLVAGATGAGKSVCLNCLLVSLLYRHTPESLRLLLVDPKRIELATYSRLPHLVHPVVTDMHLAKNALDWAVREMEDRYEAMARLGVRHITTYNEKLHALGENLLEDLAGLKPFPFLVVVIDELADLMMTAAKEVETSIVRLAQLARAAGIHLILATQRPSVDVVTGIIKANFPSRIAFQVSSKHDSRTILDAVGAEHLLGQGDMLYKGSGGGTLRVHGAFVGDAEIDRVVDFWACQAPQKFDVDFASLGGGGEDGGGDGPAGDVLDDPKYAEALELVYEMGRASISMIQRRLRIGFNRAARFIEQMEQDGIIGPADGSKPRVVRRRE